MVDPVGMFNHEPIKPQEGGLPLESLAVIRGLLDESFCPSDPGCICTVMEGGEVIWQQTAGNYDASLPQHIGSVSKQFTAMAVALLVDEGKVDLDADIRTYLPSLPTFKDPDGKEVIITVKELLHMKSGLPESTALAEFNGFDDQDLTDDEKLSLVERWLDKQGSLSFTPGSRYSYCNTNYILLAKLVGAVSGKPLREFARERIFTPLEMSDSSFIAPQGNGEMQQGYSKENGSWEKATTRNCTNGACGVVATAKDMAKWDRAFCEPKLGNNPQQVMEIMRGPDVRLQSPEMVWEGTQFLETHYLGGLSCSLTTGRDYMVETHPGGIEGFSAVICRIRPMEGEGKPLTVFMASTQEQSDVGRLAPKILEAVVGKPLVFPVDETPPSLQPFNAELFVGTYSNPISGGECKLVALEKGKLGLVVPPKEKPFLIFDCVQDKPPLFCSGGITLAFESEGFSFDDGDTLRNIFFTRQ